MSVVLAEAVSRGSSLADMGTHLLGVVMFSLVGVLVLGACFWIMKRMMPFSVRKEIEEDQNTALAIIIGAVIIGMSIIIAAAIVP
jgi:uncharacterized membrane protein YjfL (UPF0719 family)